MEAHYLHGNLLCQLNIACSVKGRYNKQTLIPSMHSCKPHYLWDSSAVSSWDLMLSTRLFDWTIWTCCCLFMKLCVESNCICINGDWLRAYGRTCFIVSHTASEATCLKDIVLCNIPGWKQFLVDLQSSGDLRILAVHSVCKHYSNMKRSDQLYDWYAFAYREKQSSEDNHIQVTCYDTLALPSSAPAVVSHVKTTKFWISQKYLFSEN